MLLKLYKYLVMNGMILYLTNWFILYCSTRTLSNTIECALTLIAIKWYNFIKFNDSLKPVYYDQSMFQYFFIYYKIYQCCYNF